MRLSVMLKQQSARGPENSTASSRLAVLERMTREVAEFSKA